jgi:glutamine synthetase
MAAIISSRSTIEMEPMTGLQAFANWEKGFGDFAFQTRSSNAARDPVACPAPPSVLCDLVYDAAAGRDVPQAWSTRRRDLFSKGRSIFSLAASGRAILPARLEFFLYNQTYEDVHAGGYRTLLPSSDYRIDYHTMQPARDESLFRAIRNLMAEAGVPVESSKGEWGRGQHEVNFTYSEPLEMADRHVIFKQGVKELATQHGKSVTFMAKPSMTETRQQLSHPLQSCARRAQFVLGPGAQGRIEIIPAISGRPH